MSHVYVLAEHSQTTLDPVTAELITAARPLGVVSAVVVGAPGAAQDLASELGRLGAEQVIDASADDYAQRLIVPEVDALHALGSANPAPIVIADSERGSEIAGRIGARLASGVVTGVSSINADGTADSIIYGGTYSVKTAVGGQCPVYTIRPGAVSANPQAASGAIAAMPLPSATAKDVQVVDFRPAELGDRPALSTAKTVVAGGRGVGSAEGFIDVVEPLADVLEAAVGASRDATDEGWYDAAHQVGQTGETVAPDLYIALGISGAIQHTSGMQTAGTIVVVNQDADEPFFKIADLGVVGDLHEIAPALTVELRGRK